MYSLKEEQEKSAQKAIKAMKQIAEYAKLRGLSEMTPKEINEMITLTRKEKKGMRVR